MTRWWLIPFLVGCAMEDAPVTSETTQLATGGQGTSAQGTSAQGTSAQGTSAQGTSAQGTTSSGSTASNASVAGTALRFWVKRSDGKWALHTPSSICLYNSWFMPLGCTTYNLSTQPSPLAGARFPATFLRRRSDGVLERTDLHVQIGTSDSHIGAVTKDTSKAFFDLSGSNATGSIVGCDNPSGCRKNTDLWLYDVKVVQDGKLYGLCPPGERAMALAGKWDVTATHDPDTSEFTFACTNGTIAKCVRWGYRPWTSAKKYSGDGTLVPLAPYHQACVRAAMADYCGTGQSFTKEGTVIDVYDYIWPPGFIPATRQVIDEQLTAVVWESQFDAVAAWRIDHARYEELQHTSPEYNIESVCGDTFATGLELENYRRYGDYVGPSVYIDSTPACAHSELMVGKWLHRGCSTCTRKVPNYCNDPTDSRGWDGACVSAAQNDCTAAQRMAPTHSECQTGRGLSKYTSGCTLLMSTKGYWSCFDTSNSSAWTSTCVSAANQLCTGGQERRTGWTRYGFCGTAISLTNAPSQ